MLSLLGHTGSPPFVWCTHHQAHTPKPAPAPNDLHSPGGRGQGLETRDQAKAAEVMDLREAQAPPVHSMHDYTQGWVILLQTSRAPPHLYTMFPEDAGRQRTPGGGGTQRPRAAC